MMIGKFLNIIRKVIASSERDRFQELIDHMDDRLDFLSEAHAETRAKLASIEDISFANNEALEQKLNATKAGQEHLYSVMDLRFTYVDRAFDDIKALIKGGFTTK